MANPVTAPPIVNYRCSRCGTIRSAFVGDRDPRLADATLREPCTFESPDFGGQCGGTFKREIDLTRGNAPIHPGDH